MADIIQPGDELPGFHATTLQGATVDYRRDVWQKKLVVLVTFASPASPHARAYRDALARRERELTAYDTTLLFRDGREGSDAGDLIPSPSVIIADRWGEVRDVRTATDEGGLPSADAIVEWLRFVQVECPECQGETK